MPNSRYIIGIDLGTTNSAVSFIDSYSGSNKTQVLSLLQLDDYGTEAVHVTLPSVCYLTTEAESGNSDLALSFRSETPHRYCLGQFALQKLATTPGRVVVSAKSWLCHGGVDRQQRILPWNSEEIPAQEKLSPVAVSSLLLKHILDYWNATIGAQSENYRFENQEVIITVPASFDEVAQVLTLKAAEHSGYPDTVHLLEEPQAAFYAWLENNDSSSIFRAVGQQPKTGRLTVLVCDVGGGTTDLSLFEVSSGKEPQIRRIAVSDHILLGGDNIDLSLAYRLEELLRADEPELKLTTKQWNHLVFSARGLKEHALSEDAQTEPDRILRVSLLGDGSSLFDNSRSIEISVGDLIRVVIDGFFPVCASDDTAKQSLSGLREWGLPFAKDSAVTRYLAQFLAGRRVDAVLFNGGTLKSRVITERLCEQLSLWQDGNRPIVLNNEQPELSVARGAARYGLSLRESVTSIKGGYARAIYLEVQSEQGEQNLVCLLPRGIEAGQSVVLESRPLQLVVGQPVRVQLHYSTKREGDRCGDLIDAEDDSIHPLLPLQTLINKQDYNLSQDKIRVSIEARVNQLGLLQLACCHNAEDGRELRWKFEFNLKPEEANATEEFTKLPTAAQELLRLYYGKGKATTTESPKKLLLELEQILKQKREDWDLSLLRSIWDELKHSITRRNRSTAHEAAWLNLAGFCLRPGYGAELDKWRIKELWRVIELGLAFPKQESVVAQWWIMWRRVAGGLATDKQQQLFKLASKHFSKKASDISPELYRLLGTLEHLPLEDKRVIGAKLLDKILGRKITGIEHYIWSLGRLGSRVPLYGSAHLVLPPREVESWFLKLHNLDWTQGDLSHLNQAFAQVGRITGDRMRDLPLELQREIEKKLRLSKATARQLEVVKHFVPIEEIDRTQLFGERLPLGLVLAQPSHFCASR